ncbi:MAG: DUF4129 domain-containing protein [Chloroflexota bacterium]|nr:DUF4129 domain-containing protein [Chloroflexota bacterium]
MRSSWQVRLLLPAAQVLAEGGWLAVVYAAAQALAGGTPHVGPLEFALLVTAGMLWGRRRRWTGTVAEAVGLPLLAVAGGAAAWFLDPEARGLLIDGHLTAALSTHAAGWIGAVAVWRGETHRSAEDDDVQAAQLLRWAVPGLAAPWLIGHMVTAGSAESAFTAAAFMGTLIFVGSAFTAVGLARLEAVRAATGSDWQANRSWLLLVLGVAVGLTLIGIPAAAFMGVPAKALLTVLIGPLRAILLALLLVSTPLIVVIAALTELLRPFLPENITLPTFALPNLAVDPSEVVSDAPTWIFYGVVALLAAIELIFLAVVLYLRWQERRRDRFSLADAFEERSIVIPPPEPVSPLQPVPGAHRRPATSDPAGAYLAALDALERDGRWARASSESPAIHAARARDEGLSGSALPRLAAAYQLVRYAGASLTAGERRRGPSRLARLRKTLRRAD